MLPTDSKPEGSEPSLTAAQLRARLLASGAGAKFERLAEVALDEWFDCPLNDALPATWWARAVCLWLRTWVDSPTAVSTVETAMADVARALKVDPRRLGDFLPHEAKALGLALANRRYAPDRQLILSVIDREPVRDLLRGLLYDALIGFGQKMKAPVADSGVARSLGGLARFAAEQAKARTGPLGALAGGMVSAVSSEVEKQFERRAREFADEAIGTVLSRLADELSSPHRQSEQGELRAALLEGIFQLPVAAVGAEIVRLDFSGGATMVLRVLRTWLSSPRAEEELAASLAPWAVFQPNYTLGQLLDAVGQRANTRRLAAELLAARIEQVVRQDAFGHWLSALFASPG